MSKYIYSAGDYSVLWDRGAFHVTAPYGSVAADEGSYPLTADGLGLAIARARYKGGDYLRQVAQHGCTVSAEFRRKEAEYCTAEGVRIFALGQRRAHAEWLEE